MRIHLILAHLTFPGLLSHTIESLLTPDIFFSQLKELQVDSIPCSLTQLQKSRNSKNTQKTFMFIDNI